MRCNKCGYISFDHLSECGKCGANLVAVRDALGMRPEEPSSPFYLKSLLSVPEPSTQNLPPVKGSSKADDTSLPEIDFGDDLDIELDLGDAPPPPTASVPAEKDEFVLELLDEDRQDDFTSDKPSTEPSKGGEPEIEIDFGFDETPEPVAAKTEPAREATDRDLFELSDLPELNLDAIPATASVASSEPAPAVPAAADDFEITFDFEEPSALPPVPEPPPVADADESLDIELELLPDLDLEPEPVDAPASPPVADAGESFDIELELLPDLDLEPEPVAVPASPPATDAGESFDIELEPLSDLDDLEPVAAPASPPVADAGESFDIELEPLSDPDDLEPVAAPVESGEKKDEVMTLEVSEDDLEKLLKELDGTSK